MKKVWVAFAIAIAASVIIAGPALAWGGSDADVDCSDIDVTDDTPTVGTTITFSGTVDITAEAHTCGFMSSASANSCAYYVIFDPEGCIVDQGYNCVPDWDCGFCWASADASQTFVWSSDVYVALVGDYIAEHGGSAWASYFTVCPFRMGADCDFDKVQRTVTSHAGAGLGMVSSPPRLTIQLPADLIVEKPLHAEHFFGSDGWDDPTSEFIAYSDGIWQVEIDDGTVIELDGKWRKYTWIEVDDQGNVTARYGKGGHTVAEEIGLSSPITITKVG
jgi:hypothetical protein